MRNLTNSLYDMKRKFDEREGRTAKRARIEPDESLVQRAYEILKRTNRELVGIYMRKLDMIEGETWNEKQTNLQDRLIKKVRRSFKKCRIDVENTNLLFGVNVGLD